MTRLTLGGNHGSQARRAQPATLVLLFSVADST